MLVRIHGTFTYYTARQPTYPVATADLWESLFPSSLSWQFYIWYCTVWKPHRRRPNSSICHTYIRQTENHYVLSNRDKLFVFNHSDLVDHSEVVFLHYPMMQVLLRGSVRTSGVTSNSLDGEQPLIPTAQNEYHMRFGMRMDSVREKTPPARPKWR